MKRILLALSLAPIPLVIAGNTNAQNIPIDKNAGFEVTYPANIRFMEHNWRIAPRGLWRINSHKAMIDFTRLFLNYAIEKDREYQRTRKVKWWERNHLMTQCLRVDAIQITRSDNSTNTRIRIECMARLLSDGREAIKRYILLCGSPAAPRKCDPYTGWVVYHR